MWLVRSAWQEWPTNTAEKLLLPEVVHADLWKAKTCLTPCDLGFSHFMSGCQTERLTQTGFNNAPMLLWLWTCPHSWHA